MKTKKRNRPYGPFSSASKFVPDHIALSFSTSGDKSTANCDKRCRLLELCYAVRLERIYSSLERKLVKHHEIGPVKLLVMAIGALKDDPISWGRFSIDGSLPDRSTMDAGQWREFTTLLRLFVTKCQQLGAKWHIPTESRSKARSYRSALKDLGVVVRRSDQSTDLETVISGTDNRSWVACQGELHSGCVRKDEIAANTEYAQRCAKRARAAGVSTVVCPAIIGNSHCGECVACASDLVDLVIYPFHG